MAIYYNTSATSSTTIQNLTQTWAQWSIQTSSTTAYLTDSWGSWNQNYKVTYQQPIYAYQETEADRLAREQRESARRVAYAKKQEEEAAAKQRAEELLFMHLTPEQREEAARLNRFTVIGADGKEYRVFRKWGGSVQLIEKGKIMEEFCVHPRSVIPVDDSILAQKLLLETDPAHLRRIANVTTVRRAA